MLQSIIRSLKYSLAAQLALTVGGVLLIAMSLWAYTNVADQQERLMENILLGTDRLTNTVRLGTHYAMMLNSRDDITQIISNVGRQKEIENIRIYNKQGQIKYSDQPTEVDRVTNIEAEACYICHRTDPPLGALDLAERTRIFRSPRGYRLLGIITPIGNEPGCSSGECHFHPADKKILGALDTVVSLEKTDREIAAAQRSMFAFTAFIFLATSAIIVIFLLRFVNRPIRALIAGTQRIAGGEFTSYLTLSRKNEMGHLAEAINQMGDAIATQRIGLKKQRDEYQVLFELVPCLITVQDRDFRLLRFNREFARRFAPREGDTCFRAYKGRERPCESCPVQETFRDGRSHYTEESGINKDGTQSYWLVRTSAIRDENDRIVAAMEISHDITERRQLEVELAKSERKYHAIFSNIPNPVFVLDPADFTIMDCNHSVVAIYGYTVEELVNTSFWDLFVEQERKHWQERLATAQELLQVRQVHKSGRMLYVNIRISPSEYADKKVLLVTTNDITQRLEAEQQLIQAGKMTTLGEMASGVAHELNQPLSVIKTISSFFMRKVARQEAIAPDMLSTMLAKADTNVDRATRIIHHMRQFARKSDMVMQRVKINEILHSAFDIFSQQLKAHGIAVLWELCDNLPDIEADPQRLEQVFINLLLNARDAIEEKWQQAGQSSQVDHITIHSAFREKRVICRICDTGIGIAPQVRDKIFEPFFTTKEVGKGTGLGLSISYGIVRECRGRLECKPNTDSGTCFELDFPVAENSS
ncbi:MAG: histidine kinase [Desulfatitalea sp. BRH_c12]|nr:MAG: histidine kinase [Desulfatitalea sp. BRH_c12]